MILAGLAIIVHSRFQAAEAEATDCYIMTIMINEDVVPNDEGVIEVIPENTTVKCFDTPAEHARWASAGAVDLPDDTSQQEVDEAFEAYYQAYYESLKASENKSE